jgi:hypothetical protein
MAIPLRDDDCTLIGCVGGSDRRASIIQKIMPRGWLPLWMRPVSPSRRPPHPIGLATDRVKVGGTPLSRSCRNSRGGGVGPRLRQ